MAIAINSNFERDQLTASNDQVLFTYSFPVFDETYLKVFQRGANETPNDSTQLLTLGTDYSVQGIGEEAGGTITLTVGATAGDIITIVGAEPIDRLTVFQDLNPLTVALNQQLNELTVMVQQLFTYWDNLTPHYNYDELIYAPIGNNPGVRPFKRILPMLPPGHVWVGRGNRGDVPDDIVTAFLGGAGSGNVVAANAGMRPSFARWTGVDFILDDSDMNPNGSFIEPTAGSSAERTGWTDDWGATHWPAHAVGDRPAAPQNGDTYYDTGDNQFYGYLNGVWMPFQMGGTNPIIIPITQIAHGLTQGNWVRISAADTYVKAQADTRQNAEVVGVVRQVIDANHFILQVSGKMDGVFVAPFLPNPLVAGTGVYFLSATTPGLMTLNEPVVNGQISKPVFDAINASDGYIISLMRGIVVGGEPPIGNDPGDDDPSIVTITQPGHGFVVSDWIYVDSDTFYDKAIANASFEEANAVGVVIEINVGGNPDVFKYQTEGYNVGTVILDGAGNPIVAGTIYFLSATVAGRLQNAAPNTVGQYSKPCYVQDNEAVDSGVILPQRPLIVQAGPPGGFVGPVIVGEFDFDGIATEADFPNVFTDEYDIYRIVGININFSTSVNNHMRVYTTSGLKTSRYLPNGSASLSAAGAPAFDIAGQTNTVLSNLNFAFEIIGPRQIMYKSMKNEFANWVQGVSSPSIVVTNGTTTTSVGQSYIGSTEKWDGFKLYNHKNSPPLSGRIVIYGTKIA